MTRDEILKIYRSGKSSKEDLRRALAAALGVEYKSKEKAPSVFKQCLRFWMIRYKTESKVDYSFGKKDGIALAGIIKKIEALGVAAETVYPTFEALITKLPDWYKQNAYSLPVVNAKFNEIVASIRKNNGTGQSNISSDFKDSVYRDLTSGGNR